MGQNFMVFFKHTSVAGFSSVLNCSFFEVKHKINEKDQLGEAVSSLNYYERCQGLMVQQCVCLHVCNLRYSNTVVFNLFFARLCKIQASLGNFKKNISGFCKQNLQSGVF